ncbi:S8 family serine peptidase [Massilia niastensis]|uniref:S8 family serine peptidase n=1 Tax=Massilia niastensis TaxID=544911 RepID=UPI0003676008|nr:S8 family serine peptidase [Massilia niastensis]
MIIRPYAALVLTGLLMVSLQAMASDTRRPYIVQLTEPPAASYQGGVTGFAATRAAPSQRLDPQAQPVRQYAGYLRQRQAGVQALVSSAPVLHDYQLVFNGFSAMLTDAEVRQLKASGQVANIWVDEPRKLQTSFTPQFLGLDQQDGLWNRAGGAGKAGEDVIVGILDSGLWPENPAFADRVDSKGKPSFANDATLAYGPAPARWQGTCQTGEGFTAAHCNNKLIGARYFDATFRAYLEMEGGSMSWTDFRSPRDSLGGTVGGGGHGTHTASTAAGNHGVEATVGGAWFGTASGMAPRARVAMYKVCWSYNDPFSPTGNSISCWTGDSIQAIEQAVADGVHVLNFSIGGGGTVADPVELAFLHAANAGVFVAASAGNAGPNPSVAHISPWLTTVAASTHNRFQQADLQLGSGVKYAGASLNATALPAGTPIVTAASVALPGADPERVALCFSTSANGGAALLDPAKVNGAIVVCQRGQNARVDKSAAVSEAGGAGMVLVDDGNGLVADPHAVPSLHVSAEDGAAILAYAVQGGASASLGKFFTTMRGNAPVMAAFSSRGPNRYDGNVFKPDLAAPGVNILAGVTPGLTQQQRDDLAVGSFAPPSNWGLYQGTSMSSPHVAGLAALLRQRHPDWSPSAIKSALMTTAYDTLPDGLFGEQSGTLPWGQGAGHVAPNAADDPGLVYTASASDYKKYLCGRDIGSECGEGKIEGYELNQPGISIGNVIGTTVVKRSVTNVGATSATYTGKVEMAGFSTVLSPSTLTLAPGETKSFTLSVTRTSAIERVWRVGKLTWTDGRHVVRSPITARIGRDVVAPTILHSELASDSKMISVSTDFSGRMGAATGGLREIQRTQLRVGQSAQYDTPAQMQAACRNGAPGVLARSVNVPANAMLALFELFDRDTGAPGDDDLDLVLLDPSGALVSASAAGGSNEQVIASTPAAGEYKLCVIGYQAANGSEVDFSLSSAIVAAGEGAGTLTASVPSRVYTGKMATVNLSWSGLEKGKRYVGALQYMGRTGAPAATTMMMVETDDPLPLARTERAARVVDAGK